MKATAGPLLIVLSMINSIAHGMKEISNAKLSTPNLEIRISYHFDYEVPKNLHTAICTNNIPLINELLDTGANVMYRDIDGNTELHLLAYYGDHPFDATLAIARRLAAMSSQLIQANCNGKTPSMILAERKRYDPAIGFWRREQWYTKLMAIFKKAEQQHIPREPKGGFAVIPFTFKMNNEQENHHANKKPIFAFPRWLFS